MENSSQLGGATRKLPLSSVAFTKQESRENSFVILFILGTFAVVCLMVGHVVERETEHFAAVVAAAPTPQTIIDKSSGAGLLRSAIYKEEANNSFPSQEDMLDEKKLELAIALSLLVGLFQV